MLSTTSKSKLANFNRKHSKEEVKILTALVAAAGPKNFGYTEYEGFCESNGIPDTEERRWTPEGFASWKSRHKDEISRLAAGWEEQGSRYSLFQKPRRIQELEDSYNSLCADLQTIRNKSKLSMADRNYILRVEDMKKKILESIAREMGEHNTNAGAQARSPKDVVIEGIWSAFDEDEERDDGLDEEAALQVLPANL